MNPRHLVIVTFLLVLILAGCVGYAPHQRLLGQDRTALTADMGLPEREYESQGLKKLHFPRGPSGSHTYFVYLDSNERVIRWEQVLTEERFDTIRSGMTREQVIDTLGISKITNELARDRGYVWHYRYQNEVCRSFMVEFTAANIVRSTHYIIRGGRRCKYVGPG